MGKANSIKGKLSNDVNNRVFILSNKYQPTSWEKLLQNRIYGQHLQLASLYTNVDLPPLQ